MKTKKLFHICMGRCGFKKLLDPSKRHYCNCNPKAKFRMIVETDAKLANQIVGNLK